jgi:hypothetical protein
VSKKDFAQKLDMRRAYWAMGASTRLEVKLGSLVPRAQNRADRQEWTDIDVLAVHYSPLTGLTQIAADCKTGRTRVAERLFWLRGVMELIDARSGYLVRDEPLSASTRQLALRLGITALDRADRAALLDEVTADDQLKGFEDIFEPSAYERWEALLQRVPRELDRLMRYRDTGYWFAPKHRNLTYLPSVVSGARELLSGSPLWSMPLISDLAWLYLLAALRGLEDMTRLQLANPTSGLAFLVVGDERERRDKEFVAEQLRRMFAALPQRRGELQPVEVVPPYYGDLTDLVTRILRRRGDAVHALRVLEYTSITSAGGGSGAPASALFNPLGIKLASDVVRFLVKACGLNRRIQDDFDLITTASDNRKASVAVDLAAESGEIARQDNDRDGETGGVSPERGLFPEQEAVAEPGSER